MKGLCFWIAADKHQQETDDAQVPFPKWLTDLEIKLLYYSNENVRHQ